MLASSRLSHGAFFREMIVYGESIKLLEMPEHGSISLCVYVEHDALFQLGERIYSRFPEAYMNGYNWDAVIAFYVGQKDPELMEQVGRDPEAGMYAAYMSYSPENLEKMKRFESLVRDLLSDDEAVMSYIEEHHDEIEWD
jgi:hypothetical protein